MVSFGVVTVLLEYGCSVSTVIQTARPHGCMTGACAHAGFAPQPAVGLVQNYCNGGVLEKGQLRAFFRDVTTFGFFFFLFFFFFFFFFFFRLSFLLLRSRVIRGSKLGTWKVSIDPIMISFHRSLKAAPDDQVLRWFPSKGPRALKRRVNTAAPPLDLPEPRGSFCVPRQIPNGAHASSNNQGPRRPCSMGRDSCAQSLLHHLHPVFWAATLTQAFESAGVVLGWYGTWRG